MAKGPGAATSRVWPSGAALATTSAPILPPAPPRFSTRKGWPSLSCNASASSRVTMSFDPPGGKGTTRRTGRSGQAACARAGKAMALASSPRRVIRCILRFLPFGRECAAGPGAVNLLAAAHAPR